MKRTLHIFAKDVRLYWIEIMVTLTVTALFIWIYPSWGNSPYRLAVWPWVPGTITVLLPVSWLLLITRVIHAESLVGERQFWITRPYRWPELLAAKALFVVTFVYVPFFVAQCWLLWTAGMHPFAYLPGLLFNLLLVTGFLVLPMACLAVVTSSFARMLLGLLFVVLFIAGMGYLSTVLPESSTSNSFGDVLMFVVPVGVFAGVLLIQYVSRNTVLARYLLVALAVAMAGLGMFGPEDMMMGITYPVSREASGMQIAFSPVDASDSGSPSDPGDRRELMLGFPVQISGITPEGAVRIDNARVSILGAGGEHWTSHWQETSLTLLPEEKMGRVSLKVNRAFYMRVRDTPVSVQMWLALTTLKSGKVTRMVLPKEQFTLPGGGVCRTAPTWWGEISCLYPMRHPSLMHVETRFTTENCSTAPPANDGDRGLGWIGTLDAQPAEFGLTSVWESSVYLPQMWSDKSPHRQHLCPGSPLTYTPYAAVSRMQQRIAGQLSDLRSLGPSSF